MFPTVNGLGLNLANVLKMRDQRAQYMAENPEDQTALQNSIHAIGDPGWDAFFGGMQNTADAAHDAGMKFKVNTAGFGNLRPSIAALKRSY